MRSKSDRGRADRRVFHLSQVASVKAVACEMPAQLELPFSRFSIEEIRRVVIEKGVVEAISVTTLWEWLHEDGLRPWTHRPWIFPRSRLSAQRVARAGSLPSHLGRKAAG